ncbi:hypothetical protein EDB85DRAFT_2142996 [Lactarius pseudohatsudake]|nr:hypothetical protein EDB85DRAFT_2142996 [Lactarius pseudohatsudake]
MYLPPPTPTNLKLARTLSLSGPATQKVDGVSFPEMPAPVSHVPEPQQATLALGPSDLPLISPLGRLTTHLPTPQSPSNASPYLKGSAESPSFNSPAPDAYALTRVQWRHAGGRYTRETRHPRNSVKLHPGQPPPPHPHPGPLKMESPGGSGALVASLVPQFTRALDPLVSLYAKGLHLAAAAASSLVALSNSSTRRAYQGRRSFRSCCATTSHGITATRLHAAHFACGRFERGYAWTGHCRDTRQRSAALNYGAFKRRAKRALRNCSWLAATGDTVAPHPNEPTAPPAPSRALEWASTFTPGPRGSSSTSVQEDAVPDGPINEREARKRRRLEAFRRVPTRVKTSLHPVEVEGKGRVLLDVGAEEVSELLEELQSSAAGKKRGAKKRRRVGARIPRREDAYDEEFPWNVRTHERRELEAAEEADRMRWIGKFLDEDSDAKSSEAAQDEDVPPIRLDHADPPPPVQHEHGRMIPSRSRDGTSPQRILLPSDPADARAALLSKQSVRALAARRRLRVQSSADGDDEEILCICRGRDDGRELVQVRRLSDVVSPGVSWDRRHCGAGARGRPVVLPQLRHLDEQLARPPSPSSHQSRKKSPHDGGGTRSSSRRCKTPQQGSDWRIPLHGPGGPTTPKTNRTRAAAAAAAESSSRSSFGSRNGPHTPRNSSASAERVRVYTTTPGADERIFHHHHHDSDDNISPFDPTSTPSRGMHVGASVGSVFATPKWQVRAPPPLPPPPPSMHAPPSPHHDHRTVGSALPLLSSPYRTHEDTPVDRSAPRPPFPSKRMQESPLTGRGAVVRGYPYQQGSPAPLGRKGKERQGTGRR